MSVKLLQINLKFSISPEEYEKAIGPLASQLAAVAGLRWTILLTTEKDQEAGAIYLFEDEASLNAFLGGPIVANISSNPALSDITVKIFNVMEEQTATTKGPV